MAFSISWNVAAEKYFESGIDRAVLYLKTGSGANAYPLGVPWEGMISVTEKPGGAEPTDLWANNVKYAQLLSAETFEGTIEAYTYPEDFLEADGFVNPNAGVYAAQQTRVPFGLCYRTYVGNEESGQKTAYKIHVIYGCLAQPSEVPRETLNDSPNAATFSWDFQTTPVDFTGYAPVSKMVFDSRTLPATGLTAVQEALYGNGVDDAELPLPDALLALAQTV